MTQKFEQDHNCQIIVNIAGSSTLYQQITSGSPCDVFLSADFKWGKQLDSAGLLYDGYQNFTKNSLIVILPKDNPANITSLLDLTKSGVKIVMPDVSIPAGSYANKTLTKIDQTWGNASSSKYLGPEWENFKAQIADNTVSYELQVEDVVGKVAAQLGTADAGIAFVSDSAAQGSNLQYIQIPDEVNTIGTYSVSVIGTTSNTDLATAFADYWLTNEAKELLAYYGFGT
jgi:molybdate transport system substrate-binding protein